MCFIEWRHQTTGSQVPAYSISHNARATEGCWVRHTHDWQVSRQSQDRFRCLSDFRLVKVTNLIKQHISCACVGEGQF